MNPAKKYTFTIAAGGSYKLLVQGKFFRIIACSGLLRVSSDILDLDQLGAGDGVEETPFSGLTFKDQSGGGNTVTVVVSDSAFLNAPNVSMAVTANKAPQVPVVTPSNTAITVASQQLLPANTARQYLLVQNKDAIGNVWLRFGAAATQALGLKIAPGGFWEWNGVIPTDSLNVIGDAANANFLVMEG